jgi:hypothetical protein
VSGWRQRGSDGGGKVARVITPQEHNKFVALAQLGYAGFHLLMMIVVMAFEAFMFRNIYSQSQQMGGGPPPTPFIVVIFVFIGFFSLVMTVPSVVAGYALLKRRRWAKVAGIVAGVTAATSFPIGTAVAVYTFWFLFSDVGKQLYGGKNPELPPLPPKDWPAGSLDSGQQRTNNYTEPPDWR